MPALYAWRFQPADIVRKSVKLKGVSFINKVLTVAQYAFSIAVLSAAISFSNNQQFLDDLDVGYANEDVYALELQDQSVYPVVKQQIDQIAGVQTVGAQNHIQRFGRSSYRNLLDIDTASYEIHTYTLGDQYLDIMEIPITLGRDFISGSQSDQENSIIVNQEFVNQYFKEESPIDQVVKIDGKPRTIVGIYANLIHDVYNDAEDKPTAFMYAESDEYRYLIAKVDGLNKTKFEDLAKDIWSENVDSPYLGYWQKDLSYGSAVRDTENLRIIFLAMAILGGILSIAGIFSLSRLNVAKRLKEISIRKVLGSSFRQLLITINRSFIIILSISVIIGCMLGYFISDFVLGMVYEYYVDISPFTSLGS
ncbi:MAG: FtsX-like permease family protein, partial [Bacteroidota bacterium]